MMRSVFALIVCVSAWALAPASLAQTPLNSTNVKVTLLGTGSPTLSAERMGPCTLVEAGGERLLFDAGRGCAIRAAQANVVWRDLRNVFLTHLHADHTFALSDLFLTGWILGRVDALEVRGPKGTKDMMEAMVHGIDLDVASRLKSGMRLRQPPRYATTEIESGVVYEHGGLKVTAFEVDHSLSPAFGYRIDVNNRSVVLSGDTRQSDTLVRHAQGVDVLVHEVAFGKALTTEQQFIAAAHTLPDTAGQVFAATKPRLAIYSHLILFDASDADVLAATRKTYSGRVEVGTDLTVIEVGDGINVRRPR